MRIRKSVKVSILTFLFAFLVIQFWPVSRKPPVAQGFVPAPEEVLRILRKSCFDCHSNRTRWPWYGYVAPFSWLVEDHVQEAREALNFTTWDVYDEDEQLELQEEVWDEIDLGKMPPDYYLVLHPDSELSPAERRLLESWSEDASL